MREIITSMNPQLNSDDVREFADFMEVIMKLEPDTRPTAAKLLEHPWLQTWTPQQPNHQWSKGCSGRIKESLIEDMISL